MTRRFYKEAVTSPAERDFWEVRLDGKGVKTPMGKPLRTSSRSIADRIRDEWTAQGDEIRPETMPITRLLGVSLERADTRDELISDIRAYAATDYLSYRADTQGPSGQEEFARRQADALDPVLEWAAGHGMPLRTTVGIVAIEQDPLSLDRLAEHARLYDDLPLTLFAHLTATFGSAVLALAVMQGHLEAGEAFDLSQLDELYREETWGADEDASARAALIRDDTVAMCSMLPDLAVPSLDTQESL